MTHRPTTRHAVRFALGEVLASQPVRPGECAWITLRGAGVEVDITSTRHRYGGPARWFACPNCRRRCRVLYRHHGILACRQCHGLLYASQFANRKMLRSLHREWQLAKLAEIAAGAQGGAGCDKADWTKG